MAETPNPLKKMSAEISEMLIDSIVTDLAGLEDTRTDEEIHRHLYLAACVGYFVGRIDQIEDIKGTNAMRAVKSKDIPATLRVIAQLAQLHGVDEQIIIDELKRHRKLPGIKSSSGDNND